MNLSLLINDFNKVITKNGIPLNDLVSKKSNILLSTTLNSVPYCFKTDFLKLNWCSKANLKQRAGRVGRINNGFVFRLIHKKFYEKLKETPKPEILRSSLDKIILKIKVYSNEEPYNILQECINCPNENEVKKSIKKLKFLGALSMTNDENLSGNLTYLGKIYNPIDNLDNNL